MTTTTNLGVTLIDQAQAQKEVTINQALNCLDAMIFNSVADKDLATPPGSPTTGVVYLVAASPTGAWAGKATYLAYFDQVWRFIAPQSGMRVFVRDESAYYQFNGTVWQAIGTTVANGGTGQTSFTDGQLLIGNSTGNILTKATLTAGSGISITNGAGSITIAAGGGGGSGDVVGPSSAADNAVARFDTTTGKLVQNSGVVIDDSNNISGVGTLAAGAIAVTSSSANALAVGPNGTTNPVLQVDGSPASAATGVKITPAASGSGVTIGAISSGTNENITINCKGTGQLNLQTTASGNVVAGRLLVANVGLTCNGLFRTTDSASGTASNRRVRFENAADTGLTAGTEAKFCHMAMNTAVRQHASNTNITLQRDMQISGTTHSFASATGTFTDLVSCSIEMGDATTNAAATNIHALRIPTIALAGAAITNSYNLSVQAASGATNNYTAQFLDAGSNQLFRIRADGQMAFYATNTATGTTGAQTINKPSGTVNVAASATSLVVTNSLCSTSSIVFAVIRTNDATATIKNVVPGSGSFTITLAAAATAETSVGFWIIN